MTSKFNHTIKCISAVGMWLCSAWLAAAVPVTFQVDMAVQTSLGNFQPAVGTVTARGAFQSPNQWTNDFVLTNSVGSTNIYRGTYDVAGSAGTMFEYKFVYNNNDATGDKWENRSNRSFTQTASAQTLPLVYYDDASPPGSVDVTFRVDMSVQIANNNFNPALDQVEARGSFQSPSQWTGGFVLTNSPANTNIYSGTYTITNISPGALVEYKFYAYGFLTWESTPNRSFNLPSSATNLPVVFFNNDIGSATPVTFQVDMGPQVDVGNFVPGGDLVEARGGFNNWVGGFTLTNNPSGPNSNLYSGTYQVNAAPGTVLEYKFVINGGTGPLGWESPLSTRGANRQFTVAAGTQTLPWVYFNDLSQHDLLTIDTTVTFRVNMAGAVGTDAHVFNAAADSVYINGAFLGWWGWGGPPPSAQLFETSPGSLIYTNSFLRPAGTTLAMDYKYSINGTDNEAPQNQNHFRYIRALGSYTMPQDTFGNQLAEISFGNLRIAPPVGASALITWLGRPGVHLQTRTNLTTGSWTDLPATEGLSSTNFPVNAASRFFRLIKPGI